MKDYLTKQKAIFYFVFLLFSQHVMAKEFHSLDDISQTARKFVIDQLETTGDEIEVVTGKLDQRLRLNRCSIPLEAYTLNYGTRQNFSTVGIRCNDEKPWSLYVPVTVKNFKKVAVLKHALLRNTELTEKDIIFEKVNVNRLNAGFFESIDTLGGKVLTQNLSKGAILTQHLVKSPIAIKQGQMVTLVAKNAVIEVRTAGKALSRGSIGDRIKVKNMKSRRIIEGIVVDKHLINVNL